MPAIRSIPCGGARLRRGSSSCRSARGGREAEDRDLVDRGGDVGRPEIDRPERRRPDAEVGDRLADVWPLTSAPVPSTGVSVMSAPIARRMSMTARRVGFTPTPRSVRSASGWIAAGDEPEGCSRHVAGNALVDRRHRSPSLHRDRHCSLPATGLGRRQVLRPDRDPSSPQHPFGVVARRDRLADDRRPLRPEPRQQDRRLHLSARDRGPAVDREERMTTDDGERRKGIVSPGMDRRAHRPKRFDDTSDRSAPQ